MVFHSLEKQYATQRVRAGNGSIIIAKIVNFPTKKYHLCDDKTLTILFKNFRPMEK